MSKPVPVTCLDRSAFDLRWEASRYNDGAVVRRLLAIALVPEGRPRTEAAEACGMDRQTLRDWVHHYNKEGIDGLANHRSPGRPAQLTPEQLASFKAVVEQGPDLARDGVVRWRSSDLQARLQSDFAVHYHERSVEIAVGATLVDRSTRHLRLSDAGVLFRPDAVRILADVDEAVTALDSFAGVPRGSLRVSAPFTFVVAVLSSMLPSFIARYREVRVVLDVDNRVIDMPLEPADLVIRVSADMPDRDLIAGHLLTTEVWRCASPGYLAACGIVSCIADLSLHTLIL